MTEDRGTAENRAMEQVAFRLREAFAARVSDREIGERVLATYHRFDGSKVRDFIPLLVENAVRRELVAGLQATAEPGSAVSADGVSDAVAAGTATAGASTTGASTTDAAADDTAHPDTLVA
ncbi:MAG TPA: hypothetical protein VFU73_08225 [Actinocrinis sp.]|nr:hypothetical protein [Actinocrinis sp.]